MTDPGYDEDGLDEGLYDVMGAVDTNADDVADTAFLDTNDDQVADTVVMDTDYDNVADTVLVDVDADGTVDAALVDVDEDGTVDDVYWVEPGDDGATGEAEVAGQDASATDVTGEVSSADLAQAEGEYDSAVARNDAFTQEMDDLYGNYAPGTGTDSMI